MRMIVFEGIDASGKQTQVNMLAEALKNKGFRTLKISFPRYYTTVGMQIKQNLTNGVDNPIMHHILYDLDKFLFMNEYPELEEKFDFLILDRYTLSNLAYMKAKKLNISEVTVLQDYLPKADITFFLDVPVEVSTEMKKTTVETLDVYEKDLNLQELARYAYKEIIEHKIRVDGTDELIYMVDATGKREEVHQSVMEILELSKII